MNRANPKVNVPVDGRDYEAMVMAMNQMFDTLSRDIVAAIQHLASRAAARESTAAPTDRSLRD